MDEARLLEAGDDFDIPAGLDFGPGDEGLGVAGVAHGGGGDDADLIDAVFLDSLLEALEGFEGEGHGVGGDEAGIEDACAEAGDFAIFMEGFEAMGDDAGDLEAAGVGADVDGGEDGHWVGQSPNGKPSARFQASTSRYYTADAGGSQSGWRRRKSSGDSGFEFRICTPSQG